MRKLFTTLFAAGLLVVGFQANAQKIGHVDVTEVMELMPEYKTAQTEIQSLSAQYQKELEEMKAELNAKAIDLEGKAPTMTKLRLEEEQKGLQDMYAKIQEFEQVRIPQELQTKQSTVIESMYAKVQKALDEIAAEKGYSYIFNSNPQAAMLLVAKGDDLTADLKAKLGLQ